LKQVIRILVHKSNVVEFQQADSTHQFTTAVYAVIKSSVKGECLYRLHSISEQRTQATVSGAVSALALGHGTLERGSFIASSSLVIALVTRKLCYRKDDRAMRAISRS